MMRHSEHRPKESEMSALSKLPLIAGQLVRVVRTDPANLGWVVAESAKVLDAGLLWGQVLVAIPGVGRVAVDRTWCQPL